MSYVDDEGYVRLRRRGHPMANKNGVVLEHRLIAWDAGLFTDPSWTVHHVNGIKHDNRIENLEPMPRGEHSLHHPPTWQRQRTHCPKGHPYDETNTYINPVGARCCRACTRDRMRRHRARAKAAT